MKPLGHTVVTLSVGTILYNYSHSLAGFLWFLIVGIFMDLDHYIDYIRERGVSFDFKKVCATFTDPYSHGYLDFRKLTLILHSYELPMLLWLIIFVFDLNIVWKYIAISFTLHLFLDLINNPILPLGYFLWFRAMNNFKAKKIFKLERRFDYAHQYR